MGQQVRGAHFPGSAFLFLDQFQQTLSDRLKDQVTGKNGHYPGQGLYNIARRIEEEQAPHKLNVILISVESLSASFLSRFGEQKHITPFMDDWFKKGKLFTNFYATGTRTVRGLEAIPLSIPPTPGRSIVKRPDNDHMYSLGKVFKDKGYDTAFLYGGRGYFDNMNTFFSGNGYRIVDQTGFRDKEVSFKNAWGVSDEDLYDRAIYEANGVYDSKKPFFFHIMTTSNHPPFTYPKGKIDLPPGEIDRLSSQRDLAPTLLALLHFSYDNFFFGKNILARDFKERAFIANYQKLGILSGGELLILSPGKEIALMEMAAKRPSPKKIQNSSPLVKELMSYYQGADYVLGNRLNRWADNRTNVAAN
ncbi:MAG: LTA synthase family protein [Proteobacteria bacterium]|nr:LTA synthase family protein [Pseudomonadota bacterium]